ncbi:MAG: hypothetical protein AAF566_12075 [Pseudomonadota bacterium]
MEVDGADNWMIRLLEDVREVARGDKLPASVRAIDAAIEALRIEKSYLCEENDHNAAKAAPLQKPWH